MSQCQVCSPASALHTLARTKNSKQLVTLSLETHEVTYSAGAVTQGLFHPIYILQLLMPSHNSLLTRIPNENVRNRASGNYWEVAQASLPSLIHQTSGKSEVSGEQRPRCPGCLPSTWSTTEPVQG